jgi:hypothetical protein
VGEILGIVHLGGCCILLVLHLFVVKQERYHHLATALPFSSYLAIALQSRILRSRNSNYLSRVCQWAQDPAICCQRFDSKRSFLGTYVRTKILLVKRELANKSPQMFTYESDLPTDWPLKQVQGQVQVPMSIRADTTKFYISVGESRLLG